MENNINLKGKYHSNDGPQYESNLKTPHENSIHFVKSASKSLNINITDDFNHPSFESGAGLFQTQTFNGKRWSVADGYLNENVLSRENMHLRLNAQVTKVLIEQGKAVGVEFYENGERRIVRSKYEVILSAGAYHTPQILMLSGLGPKNELLKHDIPVIKDIPQVGKNLQDHLTYPIIYNTTKETLDTADSLKNLFNWVWNKEGPLTSNVAEAGAFLKSDLYENYFEPFDMELLSAPAILISHGRISKLTRDLIERYKRGHTVGPILLRPQSIGEITLKDKNPFSQPLINHNFYDKKIDLEKMM